MKRSRKHQKIFDEFQREQQKQQEELKRQEELMTPEEREIKRQEESIQEVLEMTFGNQVNW